MSEGSLYVINEWFWSDLAGANSVDRRRESFAFLAALVSSPDRIVVLEGSPFDVKTYALCKAVDVTSQEIARIYMGSVRYDPNRCLALAPAHVAPLPEVLASSANPDDHYLLQAQRAVEGSIIVTTDQPLKSILEREGIPSELRDPFLARYLAKPRS